MTNNKKLSLIKTAWKFKKKIIAFVTIVTIIAIIISLVLPVWYKSTSVIMPPSNQMQSLGGLSALAGSMNLGGLFGSQAGQQKLLTILKSRTIKEEVALKYDLQKKYDCENIEETIEILDENITIVQGEELQIKVTLYDQNQDTVAEMTNYLVHCLDSLNILLNNRQGRNIKEFVRERLDIVIDSLMTIESELRNFMKKEGIISLEDQISAGVMNAAQIKSKIIMKEIELELANQNLGKSNPKTKLIKLELNRLRNKFDDFFNTQNSTQQLFPDFKDVPKLGSKIEQHRRKIQYYEKIIEYLGPEYEKAKIEEARNIPSFQVIDEAVRPAKKAKPRRSVIVISFFMLSVIISVYFVYFKEKLNNKL